MSLRGELASSKSRCRSEVLSAVSMKKSVLQKRTDVSEKRAAVYQTTWRFVSEYGSPARCQLGPNTGHLDGIFNGHPLTLTAFGT
jgi:hypothetical protein